MYNKKKQIGNILKFYAKFWGVRGSIACCDSGIYEYGGNTSCVEIRCGEEVLIFDSGTGIRYLGAELVKEKKKNYKIFYSHTHYDHICGLPFFLPAFIPNNKIDFFAGHLKPRNNIKKVLSSIMSDPVWPVGLDIFNSEMTFTDFNAGETIKPETNIEIKTCSLNHENGSTGYRVNYGGKSICYITDTGHVPGAPDENILGLIEGSDIVIYDSMFTEEEFKQKPHWGHSTWEEGAKLCDIANAKKLCIFHHDPEHNDVFMNKLANEAKKKRPGTVVAKEGLVLTL